jgi:hypothetical protein
VSILTASCTHHRRIGKYKKLLKRSKPELHTVLKYSSPGWNPEQKTEQDMIKVHGGRNELMQAIKHNNHTLGTQDHQSCLYKVS